MFKSILWVVYASCRIILQWLFSCDSNCSLTFYRAMLKQERQVHPSKNGSTIITHDILASITSVTPHICIFNKSKMLIWDNGIFVLNGATTEAGRRLDLTAAPVLCKAQPRGWDMTPAPVCFCVRAMRQRQTRLQLTAYSSQTNQGWASLLF